MTYSIVGGVPRGDELFGRDSKIEEIWQTLDRDNVLLLAPRRYGKTGVMWGLLDNPRAPFVPIYMDVMYMDSPVGFIIELIAKALKHRHLRRFATKLWEETRDFGRHVRNLPQSVNLGELKIELRKQPDIEKHWLDYGERLTNLLSTGDKRLLLLIDEFPSMILNMWEKSPESVGVFLKWFHRVRLDPEGTSRFVLAGSTNLVDSLDELGLVYTINDLCSVEIPPFSDDIAAGYIREVFNGREVSIPESLVGHIKELIGIPIPYLLAVFCSSVVSKCHASKTVPDRSLIDEVYEDDVLGGKTAACFSLV